MTRTTGDCQIIPNKFDSAVKFVGLLGSFAILGVLPFITGCGIYSMSISPVTVDQVVNKQEPLDLSVSIGEMTIYDYGFRLKLNKKHLELIDKTFLGEIKKTNLFREVLPRGENADIALNKRYSNTMAINSNQGYELFKWFILTPAALILPIPYPYDMGIDGVVELRSVVAGKDLLLRQYKLSYEATVWSVSLWGFVFKWDPFIEKIVQHEVRELSKKIVKDYDFFKKYSRLKKAKDIEGIKKLIPEVWSGVA